MSARSTPYLSITIISVIIIYSGQSLCSSYNETLYALFYMPLNIISIALNQMSELISLARLTFIISLAMPLFLKVQNILCRKWERYTYIHVYVNVTLCVRLSLLVSTGSSSTCTQMHSILVVFDSSLTCKFSVHVIALGIVIMFECSVCNCIMTLHNFFVYRGHL